MFNALDALATAARAAAEDEGATNIKKEMSTDDRPLTNYNLYPPNSHSTPPSPLPPLSTTNVHILPPPRSLLSGQEQPSKNDEVLQLPPFQSYPAPQIVNPAHSRTTTASSALPQLASPLSSLGNSPLSIHSVRDLSTSSRHILPPPHLQTGSSLYNRSNSLASVASTPYSASSSTQNSPYAQAIPQLTRYNADTSYEGQHQQHYPRTYSHDSPNYQPASPLLPSRPLKQLLDGEQPSGTYQHESHYVSDSRSASPYIPAPGIGYTNTQSSSHPPHQPQRHPSNPEQYYPPQLQHYSQPLPDHPYRNDQYPPPQPYHQEFPYQQPQPSTRPSHPLQQTTTNPQPTPATSHAPSQPKHKTSPRNIPSIPLTKPQIACLSKLFDIDPSPVSAMHLRVAEVTGMPRKAVRLWFQNARARLRREARNAGFRDPSTPAELKKYQWFLAEDGVRSYDIEGRDVPVKSLMQSAKELNDVLVEYTEGVFGVDRFVSGGAGNDDDDEVDEEEEDEEEEE
ncbi:hypothetical protein BCR33DRAFT_719969 [Rhizoclosmatium globosum]|uniref:Homeobox domain-containing protein n=1 Tax=Rhizoclosmatium globosum TaxID=329046 RepID=A0A1Y2BXJ2_9FUNG|nr:hypothetical protein BCR33DRAFT_719969 [Rhizoclosmatium globosum]|eukprot:ORY39489.1 hypothetical protein BCR33DRAFT_719969 [Rhizoclosmatium globosum]